MNEFNPVTIYFILYESMGIWLWLLAGLALLLLSGVVAGAVGIRRAGQSARRPVLAALAAGLITTIIAFFLVPGWTLAGFDSLNGPVDYVFALLLALVPGATVGAVAFILVAGTCASQGAARLRTA